MMIVQRKWLVDACAHLIDCSESERCHNSHRMVIRGATDIGMTKSRALPLKSIVLKVRFREPKVL